jgi:hypothetical protein
MINATSNTMRDDHVRLQSIQLAQQAKVDGMVPAMGYNIHHPLRRGSSPGFSSSIRDNKSRSLHNSCDDSKHQRHLKRLSLPRSSSFRLRSIPTNQEPSVNVAITTENKMSIPSRFSSNSLNGLASSVTDNKSRSMPSSCSGNKHRIDAKRLSLPSNHRVAAKRLSLPKLSSFQRRSSLANQKIDCEDDYMTENKVSKSSRFPLHSSSKKHPDCYVKKSYNDKNRRTSVSHIASDPILIENVWLDGDLVVMIDNSKKDDKKPILSESTRNAISAVCNILPASDDPVFPDDRNDSYVLNVDSLEDFDRMLLQDSNGDDRRHDDNEKMMKPIRKSPSRTNVGLAHMRIARKLDPMKR